MLLFDSLALRPSTCLIIVSSQRQLTLTRGERYIPNELSPDVIDAGLGVIGVKRLQKRCRFSSAHWRVLLASFSVWREVRSTSRASC